ncbi:MAG: hypothetical protein AB8H03_07400 [Saprospiraceae bacterium]
MRLINNLIFITLFFSIQLNGQDTQPGEWITINLDITDSLTNKTLGFDYTSKLATKILSIVSRNGKECKISCVRNKEEDPSQMELGDLNTGILCKPKLEVINEDVVETGMEKLNTATISLSIFIQSVQGNIIYASITKEYQGTGKNPRLAINNALRNIRVRDSKYERFLTEARGEVVRYYNQMCGTIIQEAETLTKLKKYREAIFLLWPIPYEVKCHDEARAKMLDIYTDFVEYNCKKFLFQARTYITSKDYRQAMQMLRYIDPEASCAEEAIQLMQQISDKVDEQERQYMELYKKMRQDEFELEKERFKSMGNMTKTINLSKIEFDGNN